MVSFWRVILLGISKDTQSTRDTNTFRDNNVTSNTPFRASATRPNTHVLREESDEGAAVTLASKVVVFASTRVFVRVLGLA